MKKTFERLVLAFVILSCNKLQQEDVQPPGNVIPETETITITANLGPKSGGTKAVADNGDNKITVSWAVDEHMAILYEAGGVRKRADARITEVASDGSATIEFRVEGAENDTPCTLVYPLAAARDDHSGLKDAAELLAAQDGTLNANLDVRVGEGVIRMNPATVSGSLSVTSQPAPQFAIFKITLRNASLSAAIKAKPLIVTIGEQGYTVTPSAATDVLYAALPAVSGEKVTFDAVDSEKRTWLFSAPSVSFTAGRYYQSTLKMREYVDMGEVTVNGEKKILKWAVCNVGAENPWEHGDYFAWGDPTPYYKPGHALDNPFDDSNWRDGKTGYNWDSYSWLEEDIAAAHWGDPWRMPTLHEWRTFYSDDFERTWTSVYSHEPSHAGTAGMLIRRNSGPCKGNQIFLPATDSWEGKKGPSDFIAGIYWSSYRTTPTNAGCMVFDYIFNELSGGPLGSAGFCNGLPVRPVIEVKVKVEDNDGTIPINHLPTDGEDSGGGGGNGDGNESSVGGGDGVDLDDGDEF